MSAITQEAKELLTKREISIARKALQKSLVQLEGMESILETGYLTTTQFAAFVGLTAKTVSNYASSGHFDKEKREGGTWLIHKSELERY